MPDPVVLVIDDEKNIREALKQALKMEGYLVITAENGEEGLEKLKTFSPDAVILDLKMPKVSGMEFLKQMPSKETPVIILTGHGGVEEAVETMRLGAYDFMVKPPDLEKLTLVLSRALEEKKRKERQETLETLLDERYRFENIIGVSRAFQEVLQQVKQVAATDATVLLTGESGTGKEVIANTIHLNSPRRQGPLIKVHCAALPETLLESELFGYEKGAFTGATSRRKGRFELADGGTLFLDEIGEISPLVQVKLLRVLQEQRFERIGGEETITVNVRIIAATNKNLKAMVENGSFREDLYYRLNVVHIELPPLRERREDIPLLANHFLKLYTQRHQRPIEGIHPKAMRLLESYPWPGNIRELQHTIEKLVIFVQHPIIEEEDLPQNITQQHSNDQITLPIGITLEEAEKRLIFATLDATNGNKSKTARILGIGRKTLLRKLESYGIAIDDNENDNK
jgi:DNA-binding NtrC family response regulator